VPGVKLAHPALKNCVYTLIHEGRPLQAPTGCGVCGLTHHHKTYHLALDGKGEVIVSETVFTRLEEAGLDELTAKTEVKKPPKQTVSVNGTSQDKPKVVTREEYHKS
jgi:hypothetical protein